MDDFQKLLLETFAEEVKETIQALEGALLALEQATHDAERQEQYSILARRAHNLKGAAGAAGIGAIQSLCHALEDGLLAIAGTGQHPTAVVFDVLYQAVDAIRALATSEAPEPRVELEEKLRVLKDLMESKPAAPPPPPIVAAPAPEPVPAEVLLNAAPPAPPLAEPVSPAPVEAPGRTPISATPLPPTPNPPESSPPVAPPTPAAPVEATPKKKDEADSTGSSAQRTVRIAVNKLDALTNQISEIITIRMKSEARLSDIREIDDNIGVLVREFQDVKNRLSATLERSGHASILSLELMDSFQARLNKLESRFMEFHRQALHEATTERLLTERLPEDIKRLRMRPFSTLEDVLKRTVRDASRHCKKQLRFELVGMDTEADQVVLDVIRDPLMHLLRNSVDHGVETEEEREALGKSKTGLIKLKVEGRGATLHIEVEDDGRGIDPKLLRDRLRDRNLMPDAHIEAMSDREIIDVIFLPGFSTASSLGMVSGRGIGMDVVRQAVHLNHGSVSVSTVVNAGTTFRLTMPLTFATVQGVIIKVLGHDFALPMYSLDRLIRFPRQAITTVEGAPVVDFEGQYVSVVPLSDILEVPPNFQVEQERTWDEDDFIDHSRQSMLFGAVVQANERRVTFLVDEFVGESEMVVKEIPRSLGKIKNVAGATVTWSGEVMVILDPNDLLESALGQTLRTEHTDWVADALPHLRILVCDDSLTTRTLEKNILTAAGYEVLTATNGLEALSLAEEHTFQLCVLDVDMPELNGFELASRLRAMPTYRDVPIILVTSRDTDEDKRRGLSAGADAYITKQSFTQRTFLESVRRFLG